MAFGKEIYFDQADAVAAYSAKYVFCALINDKIKSEDKSKSESIPVLDPKFCSYEVGQTVDSLVKALVACKIPASQMTGIANSLSKGDSKYYLVQATDGRWIAIKLKKENKGFSLYDPMGNTKGTIVSSEALLDVLKDSYGLNKPFEVIAVPAE